MAGLFKKGVQIVGSLILKGIITFMVVSNYENWRSHKIFIIHQIRCSKRTQEHIIQRNFENQFHF